MIPSIIAVSETEGEGQHLFSNHDLEADAIGMVGFLPLGYLPWTIIDASHERLKIVSGLLRRCKRAYSISSADDSKKLMTVLSTISVCAARTVGSY